MTTLEIIIFLCLITILVRLLVYMYDHTIEDELEKNKGNEIQLKDITTCQKCHRVILKNDSWTSKVWHTTFGRCVPKQDKATFYCIDCRLPYNEVINYVDDVGVTQAFYVGNRRCDKNGKLFIDKK